MAGSLAPVMYPSKELEAFNLLHCSPVDENGGVLSPLFPVVHNRLLCLDHVEGEVENKCFHLNKVACKLKKYQSMTINQQLLLGIILI